MGPFYSNIYSNHFVYDSGGKKMESELRTERLERLERLPPDLVPGIVFPNDLSRAAVASPHWRNALMAHRIKTPAQRAQEFWKMVEDCTKEKRAVQFSAISDHVGFINGLDKPARGSIPFNEESIEAVIRRSIEAEGVADPIQHVLKAIYTKPRADPKYREEYLHDGTKVEILIAQGKNLRSCSCRLYKVEPPLLIVQVLSSSSFGVFRGLHADATLDDKGWTEGAEAPEKEDLFRKILDNGFTYTPDNWEKPQSALDVAVNIVLGFIVQRGNVTPDGDAQFRVHDAAC